MASRWTTPEYACIARILFERWDPIQVNSNPNLSDEYDAYVPEVHQLLTSEHSGIARLRSYLQRVENDLGCLIHTDEELNAICNALAMAWNDRAA